MTKPNKQVTSLLLATVILMSVTSLVAQKRIATLEYIETYKSIAIKKQKKYRIPASITLAQGILESGSGNSKLARKANNHFGIKCHKGWTGKKYHTDDDAKNECFRKYKKAEDSYKDHSEFLTQRGRYSFLFEYKTNDYKKWAYGLKQAGYATNPKYPQLLIKIIEKYNLDKYDKKVKKKQDKKTDIKKENYIAISTANFKQVDRWSSGRKIYENNGVKLIIIEKGDTFNGLADEFDIYRWQFKNYNDLEKKHVLKIGEVIYLEKKKRKADKKYKTHVINARETIHYISQLYGISLKRIYKLNNLPKGIQLEEGKKIKLR
ncbi:MAG TPA: glucosaminidase domain-containing protein [Bacteroidales bacterium]|nr:glucosaminidase domain-containing protein [Bacteroidales bacterium]